MFCTKTWDRALNVHSLATTHSKPVHMCACRVHHGIRVVEPSTADHVLGPAIRCIWPGESFGELALLQPHNFRTATVVAGAAPLQPHPSWLSGSIAGADGTTSRLSNAHVSTSDMAGDPLGLTQSTFDDACASGGICRPDGAGSVDRAHAAGVSRGAGSPGDAAAVLGVEGGPSRGLHGVDLIKVPRELFDSAVTSLQAAQLEERLGFLCKFPVCGRLRCGKFALFCGIVIQACHHATECRKPKLEPQNVPCTNCRHSNACHETV
jgi:hypothetical protein